MVERSERLNPTVNQVLFVAEEDLQLIQPWPLELRALFDPQADRELARRIQIEHHLKEDEEEIPF